jgi:hypothetical protein
MPTDEEIIQEQLATLREFTGGLKQLGGMLVQMVEQHAEWQRATLEALKGISERLDSIDGRLITIEDLLGRALRPRSS